MRADLPAGTEKSAVRLSMCAGTLLFQSRFCSAHSERNCRALQSTEKARLNGWKVFDFPLENSGFEVGTRGSRQGIYSGVKCNGLHATYLVIYPF
jgi:hypothetical protein